MRLTKPAPKRDLDSAPIPLINVVFLMMIFFMLAGQIQPPEALTIEPPRSAQAQTETTGAVQVLLGADGQLALNGKLMTLEQLAEQLETQRPQAGKNAGGSTASEQPPSVLVKADAGVRHAQLRELLARLHSAGIGRIGLLAEPASD